jgi:TolA-binding protein
MEAGRLDDAEAILRASLLREEQIRGGDHPDALISRNNLASLLVDRGRFAEAEGLFRGILQDSERVLGPAHETTHNSRYWLACSLLAQGKRAEAVSEIEVLARLGYRVRQSGAPVCIEILRRDPRIWDMIAKE